ncbi:MAG: DMT family transporter [Lactobacillus sp.]|jgi:transporter family-2 protein|nr:DMT family transporter [Lactobacillus sp.]
MIPIVLGLLIGVGLPIQTAINSRLRVVVKSPFLSSLISFTIGTIFLAVATILATHSLFVSAHLIATQPWWLWVGGVIGVIFLTSNIILFPRLGSVQTVIMPIMGQIIMSMIIDNFGWFASPVHRLTPLRIVGALLVIAGVVLAVAVKDWLQTRNADVAKATDKKVLATAHQWSWRLFGVFVGMLGASQTAINGHVGTVVHSPIKAAFISFFIGTVILYVLVLIKEHGYHIAPAFKQRQPWWLWVGGVMGGLFVLGNSYLVPIIGTGLAVVIVLIGMIITSLLVDQFGWFGAQKQPIALVQFVGLLVMLVGVGLIKLV